MKNTKEVNLFDLVDLVQHGKETEAIQRYGFSNIWQACNAFPKDQAVQKTLSKIEQEFFKPIDWEFFDILEDIENTEDFAL